MNSTIFHNLVQIFDRGFLPVDELQGSSNRAVGMKSGPFVASEVHIRSHARLDPVNHDESVETTAAEACHEEKSLSHIELAKQFEGNEISGVIGFPGVRPWRLSAVSAVAGQKATAMESNHSRRQYTRGYLPPFDTEHPAEIIQT
jgi:hypothetical protein